MRFTLQFRFVRGYLYYLEIDLYMYLMEISTKSSVFIPENSYNQIEPFGGPVIF